MKGRIALLGVVALAVCMAVRRPRTRGWGATDEERRGVLPGDDLDRSRCHSTHAVTIRTSPAEVWPWIAQVGYGRGGWYSYHLLERAVGAGQFAEVGSGRRIIPDFQLLTVGDTVALSPNGGPALVRLDPPRSPVLRYRIDALFASPASERARAILDWTWTFALRSVAEDCRMITRVRSDLSPSWLAVAVSLLEAATFVMERKMLFGLKQRAEQAATHLEPSVGATPSERRLVASTRVGFGCSTG